jgi:hypothetical protein
MWNDDLEMKVGVIGGRSSREVQTHRWQKMARSFRSQKKGFDRHVVKGDRLTKYPRYLVNQFNES